MELAKHLKQREMGTRIVDDSFRAVFDQELEELESLSNSLALILGEGLEQVHTYFVNLAPFFCSLLREAAINHRHDLVEQLA